MDVVDLTSPSPVMTKPETTAVVQPLAIHFRDTCDIELPTKENVVVSNPSGSYAASATGTGLTKAQQTIVDLAKSGKSFFFSGAAGTGKTYTLKSIIDALPVGSTYVTALTGIASSLLPRGTTLHSFAGLGHAEGPREQVLKKAKSNALCGQRWSKATTLIIDEVSMMSKDLFELLDFLGRELRSRKKLPFGGIQVILCGDFFQLPPVSKTVSTYCFESELWADVIEENSYELLEIFRQKDERLINILNDIRYGTIKPETLNLLSSLKRELSLPSGIIPTLLVPVNSVADSINIRELEKLPSNPSQIFQASDWALDPHVGEMLPKLTLFPDRLPLRVGAQVMLLKNQADLRLWNGSRGVVVGFRDAAEIEGGSLAFIGNKTNFGLKLQALPVVRFATGQETVVGLDVYELEGVGRQPVRAKRIQIPLRLSWAITIHKSQGMSLDYLKVDASRSFEAGQAYVALSRARSIEGLQVLSFDARKCWCDPKVVEFYNGRIKKLNDQTCTQLALTLPACSPAEGRGDGTSSARTKKARTDWVQKPPQPPRDSMSDWFKPNAFNTGVVSSTSTKKI